MRFRVAVTKSAVGSVAEGENIPVRKVCCMCFAARDLANVLAAARAVENGLAAGDGVAKAELPVLV